MNIGKIKKKSGVCNIIIISKLAPIQGISKIENHDHFEKII